MTRAKPTSQAEGGWEDLPIGETFTAVWVGFSHIWRGPQGDKHDTGRMFIMVRDEGWKGKVLEPTDGNRFRCFPNYVVVSSDQSGQEHAGKRKGIMTKLGKLSLDVYGQSWEVNYNEDPKYWSTLIRVLKAGGYDLEHETVSPWMEEMDEYLEALYNKAPWLFLPPPSDGQLAEVGLEGDPLPGYTRELLLMALESLVVKKLPVVRFTTVKGDDGGCYIAYDSLAPGDPLAESGVRALIAENEDIKEAIERETKARLEGHYEPIDQSTPGMPGYESRDDDVEIVTDMPESEAEREAKATLRSHLNQVIGHVEADHEGFKSRVWNRILDSARSCGVANKPGLSFSSLPLHEANAVWLWAISEAMTVLGVEKLPDDLLVSVDAQQILLEGGIDLSTVPEVCVTVEAAAPEGEL